MSSFKPKLGDGSIILPQARVKMIMKSSPDTESISTDALYFVTKATEFFVEHLAQEIYESTKKSNELTYKGLADIVQKSDSMQFLKDMVPKKITYKEYQEILKEKGNGDLF
ncbi:chromatin accessibility complex protein 1-like [Daphnia pulex]|uniref:chromatin accessibility complex protein 1-like n=1 Tax=Daphnia pulex TaxID=6669 RepID=UPI001EDD0882|nr:chromatin accessibility complex protein 1-like [Daphnia pulex]